MPRSIALLLTATLALSGPALLLACEGEDERTRIPRSRLRPSQSFDDLSPEQQAKVRAEQHESMVRALVWPEGEGPPRDAAADHLACVAELEANRAVSTANPLVQLVWMGRCLTDKGWEIVVPEGAGSS